MARMGLFRRCTVIHLFICKDKQKLNLNNATNQRTFTRKEEGKKLDFVHMAVKVFMTKMPYDSS